MKNLVSTYRVQLHEGFPMAQLADLLPYLRQLGIKTIYASPIFDATPGSTHGYDGVDPSRLASGIGTEAELRDLSETLHETGLNWLQDIVPNHLAYHQNNTWLIDVLEHGLLSRYAHFFDIDWLDNPSPGHENTGRADENRLMAPFLGEPLDAVAANGGLRVVYDRDRLMLKAGDNEFPLRPATYATALAPAPDADDLPHALRTWIDQLTNLDSLTDPDERATAWDRHRQQLSALIGTDDAVKPAMKAAVTALNADSERLLAVADDQVYRLSVWHETNRTINYRRFFTVNGLICLNMQHKPVFDQYHSLLATFMRDGLMQGLRVDHVDGLFDPAQYLYRLRQLVGSETYLIVEKIQQADEPLPADWSIDGQSGYDFLATVNNLLTDSRAEAAFTTFYESLVGTDTDIAVRIRDRKAFILFQAMGGELDNLLQLFLDLDLADEAALGQVSAASLKLAIGQWLVWCPVYRYYGNQMPLPDADALANQQLFDQISDTHPDLRRAVALLTDCLLTKPAGADDNYRAQALRFYQRAMQFSGPLMAKGVEDTLMYTDNRFIGHNEVGDNPGRFGLSISAFHQQMQDRQMQWPLTMNTTATHDTKRGEDARARLNVLTDLPDEWLAEVRQWQSLNAELKTNGPNAPDVNDEYFIYQTLIGAFPLSGREDDDFRERLLNYLDKAWREAKRHVREVNDDGAYLKSVRAFVTSLLDPERPFWTRFLTFHHDISDFGITNSLVQTVLKFTCPGLPDLYQGGELWDFSFVDPDNRRPVDFALRQQWLNALTTDTRPASTRFDELWHDRRSGRVKLWLTRALLHARADRPDSFANGAYLPLTVEGTHANHVLAFARQHNADWLVVVVPLHPAQLARQQHQTDLRALNWADTRVLLPTDAPANWTNQLTGAAISSENKLIVKELFCVVPVAVLG